jgi:hypothetical protein
MLIPNRKHSLWNPVDINCFASTTCEYEPSSVAAKAFPDVNSDQRPYNYRIRGHNALNH